MNRNSLTLQVLKSNSLGLKILICIQKCIKNLDRIRQSIATFCEGVLPLPPFGVHLPNQGKVNMHTNLPEIKYAIAEYHITH